MPPGGTVTYTWEVPERAGPGPMDGSSVLWMYHSHTDEIADTNAGLVGPMVITRKGSAKPDGSPLDVDREVFSYFSVVNENESQFLDQNLAEIAQAPHEVAPDDEEAFEESNLMHAINGYVYGNGPMTVLRKGERVRWYLFSLGTEVDLHTPHWHGNVATVMGMRTDMAELLPGSMMIADMQPDDVGDLAVPLPRQRPHRRGNDHQVQGSVARAAGREYTSGHLDGRVSGRVRSVTGLGCRHVVRRGHGPAAVPRRPHRSPRSRRLGQPPRPASRRAPGVLAPPG